MSERRVSLGVMSALGMERLMHIRNRSIGPSSPPYVIAEVSCNHAGSEAVARALIQVAKDAGAEAVKFQFYTPDGMVGKRFSRRQIDTDAIATLSLVPEDDGPIVVGNPFSNPWAGESMYSLYDRSRMPWEWGPRLKQHCHDLGLAFIASAYDTDGLDWLMTHCVPDALKVASFEATDTPFVEAMASKGLPLIVSLGMTTYAERQSVKWSLVNAAPVEAAILHCVSAYPTPPRAAHLGLLYELEEWDAAPGFSDHTLGHAVACAAVAKGACVLEKHIQLSPFLRTADSHFSATPDEFSLYCKNVREAWEACQPVVGDPEKDSRQFRRAPGGKRGSYGQP